MAQYDVFLAPARDSASLPITNLTGHPAVCLKAVSSTACRRR